MPGRLKIRWARLAERDFDRAHGYWVEQSPRTGARFAASTLAAVRAIGENPDLGSPVLELEPAGAYRARLVGPLYRLIFRVEGEVVWIMRVWDTRRDPQGLVVDDLESP